MSERERQCGMWVLGVQTLCLSTVSDLLRRRMPRIAATACALVFIPVMELTAAVVIDLDQLTGGSALPRTNANIFFSTATERPVLMHLLSFLDQKSLAAVCQANHPYLSPLAGSNQLWKPAFARDFGPALQDDVNYKKMYLDSVLARKLQFRYICSCF